MSYPPFVLFHFLRLLRRVLAECGNSAGFTKADIANNLRMRRTAAYGHNGEHTLPATCGCFPARCSMRTIGQLGTLIIR